MTPEESQDPGREPEADVSSDEGLQEEAKAAWENSEEEDQRAGVAVGLTGLGPVVQVISPNGDVAQKIVSMEELYLLGGQMIGIATIMMQMGLQAQMQEQARLQQLISQGEEQTQSGLYVKKNR